MCNLYTTRASRDEVASYFSAKMSAGFNAGPAAPVMGEMFG